MLIRPCMSLDRRPRTKRAEAATQRPDRPKHANSRTALQRTGDLAFIAKWRLHGLPLDALHEKLNESLAGTRTVSRAQVGFDLKEVDAAWRAERQVAIETLRDRELAILDAMQSELWDAWEKSKLPRKMRRVKQFRDGSADATGNFTGREKTERVFEESDSYGDPAIMGQLLRVSELRAKICGWLAPQQVRHAGPEGGPVAVGAGAAPIVNVFIAPRPQEAHT